MHFEPGKDMHGVSLRDINFIKFSDLVPVKSNGIFTESNIQYAVYFEHSQYYLYKIEGTDCNWN